MAQANKSKARQAALKYGYRSGLEKDCASFLRKHKVKFTYEEEKIKWEDFKVRTYTPDFILENGIIIETKGRFVTADRRKHKLIKKQYGDTYDIRFLFSNPNAKLSKLSKTTYAQWCKRHGFQYSKGPEVPKEWMEEEKL
jgi:hypothetical protein